MISEEDRIYIYCKERLGHREDWPEILENLDDVSNTPVCEFNKNARSIDQSFTWESTNQGYEYWIQLDMAARRFDR